jgi:hypothetical protein
MRVGPSRPRWRLVWVAVVLACQRPDPSPVEPTAPARRDDGWSDGPNDARAFHERAALPGEVAWTDEADREAIGAQIFRYISMPSFVLADASGQIVATSDDTKLSALEARLEPEPPAED